MKLEPTDAEIRQMWAEIVSRHDGHGVDGGWLYSPVEAVLCFGLGLDAAPAPSGRTHLKKSEPSVKAIASLLRRTDGSIQSKFGNLSGDPGRQGGQTTDRLVGTRFAVDRGVFENLYRRVLQIGWEFGVSRDQLPDFLGLVDGELLILASASKVQEADLLAIIEAELGARDFASETERARTMETRLASARIGQTRFARAVLKQSGYSCAFCGLSTLRMDPPTRRFLVAGHIKPWSSSDDWERLDPANGIAGCPTHDAAFEGGLLTVDPDGRIGQSSQLMAARRTSPAWDAAFGGLRPQVDIELDRAARKRATYYRQWHASHVESALNNKLATRR